MAFHHPSKSLEELRDRLHLRLYGAAELGILAHVTEPGDLPCTRDIHSRSLDKVELFLGIDVDDAEGTGRTPLTVAEEKDWHEGFWTLLQAAARNARARSEVVVPGACVVSDPEQAAAVLLDVGSTTGPESHSLQLVHPEDGVFELRGDLVIAALSRTCLVVTGSDDEDGIRRIIELAVEQADAGAGLVSVHPVVWRHAQWLPFDWVGAYPHLADRIHDAIGRYAVRFYEQQAPTLEDDYLLVAPARLHRLRDGRTITYADWEPGIETALPVVDGVAVPSPDGGRVVLPYGEFLKRAGLKVYESGLTPPRYVVPEAVTTLMSPTGTPEGADLARLSKENDA